jgi:hypothetical protein
MGGTNFDFPKLRTSQQDFIMHVKNKNMHSYSHHFFHARVTCTIDSYANCLSQNFMLEFHTQ